MQLKLFSIRIPVPNPVQRPNDSPRLSVKQQRIHLYSKKQRTQSKWLPQASRQATQCKTAPQVIYTQSL